jgi:hypothetical protein
MNDPWHLLSDYDRFLPVGGVTVHENVTPNGPYFYIDANDLNFKDREDALSLFSNSLEYKPFFEDWKGIDRGSKVGKRFCMWGFKAGKPVTICKYIEFFDSPFGYKGKDFNLSKLVFPEFIWRNSSKVTSSDLYHMLFYRGVNTVYTFAEVFKDGNDYWDRVDRRSLCSGPIYSQDGPKVQTYISVKSEFKSPFCTYLVLEINGSIYRNFDYLNYCVVSMRKDMEWAKNWKKSLDEAVSKIEVFI